MSAFECTLKQHIVSYHIVSYCTGEHADPQTTERVTYVVIGRISAMHAMRPANNTHLVLELLRPGSLLVHLHCILFVLLLQTTIHLALVLTLSVSHSHTHTHTHTISSPFRKTHTHTHPFNGPLSGTTGVSRYQKGTTNLDFTEARDSEWQWHKLGHMQICTLLQTDNHASTPPLSFYRPDALSAAQPTASKH